MPFRLMLELLSLLAIANGTPVLVNKLLGTRFAYPLDGGAKFFDGQPLFGSSKTIRGILVAVSMTTAVGTLFGMSWKIGFVFGTVAMGGDLFSSFLKRRLHFVAGDRATGLDQIPESLFPLLACGHALALTAREITVIVVVFFVGEALLSIWLFKLHIRERPY